MTWRASEEVLRHLVACEWGLAKAYEQATLTTRPPAEGSGLLAQAVALHAAHLNWLREQLTQRSIAPPLGPDDLWVTGDPCDPEVLLLAERASHDTWHDALLDFDPELQRAIAETLLRDHHGLIRAWSRSLDASSMGTVLP
jgi:hypothetical protein